MYLVTGGCGFIGKHLVMRLREAGKEVRVLDSLSPQVHGMSPDIGWLRDVGADFRRGDVCRVEDCRNALKGVHTVIHLAAETGTGQSMYELSVYVNTNVSGTAVLLQECLASDVSALVLSSSRAVYGEGVWNCMKCGPVRPGLRKALSFPGRWNPACPSCNSETSEALPTGEDEACDPVSVYGVTKHAQEQLVRLASEGRKMSCRTLRFFNVYGAGQALNNPYTGVLGVFVNRAKQNKILDLYEDGMMTRDFVCVDDVVDALIKASEIPFHGAINIGAGKASTIREIASIIISRAGSTSQQEVTGKSRVGDVRGLVADIRKAKQVLGWEPTTKLGDGLEKYVNWAMRQDVHDNYEKSMIELVEKGLYR